MTTNLAGSSESAPHGSGAVPRVLVLGGGIPAQVVTENLASLGADVTFARIRNTPTHLYAACPGIGNEDIDAGLMLQGVGVVARDVDVPPVIRRGKEGFVALFHDGSTSVHDAIVVAPGIALKPKPSTLPEDTELFTCGMETAIGERIAFLLDYIDLSDPALGMTAMKVATQNAQSGGQSIVLFRHVPVRHLFGETLYDEARKAGVQFVRFGVEPPTVRSGDGADSPRFRIEAHDVIDRDAPFGYDCDRVTVVTAADPASLPSWARDFAVKDLDTRGFVLADSVHSHSGSAFASGVFLVGEGTGNLDLLGCVAQARSAAVQALAWTTKSHTKKASESISVESGCVRCLTCFRVCPHEAIPPFVDPVRARMSPVPALCRDCGICASVCPAVAIRVPACPEDSMIRFVSDVPRGEAERTLFVFGCQRSAGIVAQGMDMPEHVRFKEVPCAGSVSENVIWSGLAAGARGILVVGCHHGNCASHSGTDWAAARVRRTLETGVFTAEAPRVGYATVAANEPARFGRLVTDFLSGLPAIP